MVMFNPDSQKEVVGAEKMTYDEYLDVQIASLGKLRREFVNLYFNIPMGFKGEIEKVNKDKVCFKRIFTLGMFFDGGMFDGKEDHVWMDKNCLYFRLCYDSICLRSDGYGKNTD